VGWLIGFAYKGVEGDAEDSGERDRHGEGGLRLVSFIPLNLAFVDAHGGRELSLGHPPRGSLTTYRFTEPHAAASHRHCRD